MIKFILILSLLFSNTVFAKCFIKLNGKDDTVFLDVESVKSLTIKDKSWHTTNGPLIHIFFKNSIWDAIVLYDDIDKAKEDWNQMPMCIKD